MNHLNTNSYGMTEVQRVDVMSIILHMVTKVARNVRNIVVDAVSQVRNQDERVTRLPSPRQMSDFITYAKSVEVNQ